MRLLVLAALLVLATTTGWAKETREAFSVEVLPGGVAVMVSVATG